MTCRVHVNTLKITFFVASKYVLKHFKHELAPVDPECPNGKSRTRQNPKAKGTSGDRNA